MFVLGAFGWASPTPRTYWGKEPMRLSSTGPSSTLPSFRFMAGGEEGGSLWTSFNYTGGRAPAQPYDPATSCPADVFENTMPDLHVPKLPWRLQEDWGCEARASRNVTDVDVFVVETAQLRAAITPQWGGKVWSLYHKGARKQMLFNNPAHQPANIGYLKAWASGGAEWNWSPGYVGHSAFTESPVWTAVLPTRLGPAVRVWEYDRLNGTTWQVDMLLINDTLFAHPKVSNPHPVELPGYWWTCVAMPVDSDRTRVVTPASLSIDSHGTCAAWPNGGLTPAGDLSSAKQLNTSFRGIDAGDCAAADGGRGACAWQSDLSFLGNIPHSNDFFMHIDPSVEPWIAHARADGWTVVHAHPSRLNGTKFFQWGYGEFGRFQCDFLSASQTDGVPGCNPDAYEPQCAAMVHEGNYTELQVGPARTQMHTFPLPAAAAAADGKPGAYEWTEWFKGFAAEPEVMQSEDYSRPVAAVDEWLRSAGGVASGTVAEVDALLQELADVPPTSEQIVARGMPWGGLQEALLAHEARTRFGGGVKQAAGEGRGRGGGAQEGAPVRLAPGCPFPPPDETDETRPWLELLREGTFSNLTLSRVPVNFEVSDGWLRLLSASLDAGPATWLHHLFLATHSLEVGNAHGGQAHLEASMRLRPNVHAARALALLAPTADAAAAAYERAWTLWEGLDAAVDPHVTQLGADLSGEMCGWLLGNQRWAQLEAFLARLRAAGARTAAFLEKDRALHARAALAVEQGRHEVALPILREHCFPTYGGLRAELIQLWHAAQRQAAVAAKGGEPLTVAEKLALRKRLRCDGDSTVGRLDGPCVNGPPNLGYAY